MRSSILLILLMLSFSAFTQNQILSFTNQASRDNSTEPIREITDEGLNGIQFKYSFSGAHQSTKLEGSQLFQKLYIKDFSHTQDVGLPSLPAHIDFILIPEGATASIELLSAPKTVLENYLIYPALEPASDEYGASEPEFTINTAFYNSNVLYPSKKVEIVEIIKFKGLSIAKIEVHPVQYNPSTGEITVHSELNYRINFTGASQFFDATKYSQQSLKLISNYVINNKQLPSIAQPINSPNASANYTPNYLIITHDDYLAAADTLAAWKERLGFSTEIISSNSWSSSAVKTAIASRYQNYTPKPDYFVIIGDHDKVPGESLGSGSSSFASDLYYSTMDGAGDYIPDMAYGRMSVANAAQAIVVVLKSVNYDRNPIIDSTFYSTGLNCAYFQHAGNGYAERRFAQTSEDIRNYVTARGYNVDRVYVTGSSVSPTNWNNGYYSAGESLPTYLLKPTFPWNGNGTNITNYINAGRFYVFHRDHGMSSGWGDPYYTTANLNSLANGSKQPIVFSINCLTGKFMDTECFSEKLLRLVDRGAVGVFAHGEVSYSGYNDGLALGLIDAIWASPGLVPTFTGSGGVSNPSLTSHSSIYRMGDVKNQSLIRMVQTWGGTASAIQYTHELFNYFGDPAMEIKTANPTAIYASCGDTINCHNDTSFSIASTYDGMATLVVDNELISRAQITNGVAILYFSSIAGTEATITVSGHNKVPFSKSIIIEGGCPRAKITATATKFCLQDSVLITDLSTGAIASRIWNFGSGASPSSSTSNGPFYIQYATSGAKTVTLSITDSSNYTVSCSTSFNMNQYCEYTIPVSGAEIINKCSGKLYDNGGIGNYADNSNGMTTISPAGASTVTLNFSSFSFESGYDYLKIYDGPSSTSTLIGSYSGSTLPGNGQITSTSSSITLVQQSDVSLNMSGFELLWQCNYPNTAPNCNFTVSDTASCDGIISFYDQSTNGPSSWLWDFGDGITSSQQMPQHTYSSSGVYSVKLIVTNSFGNDSLIKTGHIAINMPTTTDSYRCKSGTLDLSVNYTGNGVIHWYDLINSTSSLDTGLNYTTPTLITSKTYYIESIENSASQSVGKLLPSGTGAFYTAAYANYLVFDCYESTVLHSVLVNASSAGNRTIRLENSSGSLIESRTVYVAVGQHRIILDFNIPVANDLRLVGPLSPYLYRNSGGLTYPYNLQNKISIKHSSASTPTSYYYYFYDWEVYSQCISQRLAIAAIVSDTLAPTTNFSYSNTDPIVQFSNLGNYADTYSWDFGDGNSSILENPSHTYTTNGIYNITLTATNNCGTRSFSKQIDIVSTGLQTNTFIVSFKLFPVPARHNLQIEFESLINQNLDIQITDLAGKVIFISNQDFISGNSNLLIDVSQFAQGVYSLKLSGDAGNIIRKFIVN